jgi:hypothetical protein
MPIGENAVAAVDEAPHSIEIMSRINGFHLEPRCRVCRNDAVRCQVNDLLATGGSYAGILRAISEPNARLDEHDQVTIDSVRVHAARHFPVQNLASAVYRDILERRAKENGRDFVYGLATAITPLAFLETVMVRSYETLVGPDAEIDVKTGILAASRLQELIDSRAGQADMAQMMAEMNRVIKVVQTYVPREHWPALQAALKDQPVEMEGELTQQPQPKIRIVPIDDSPDEEDERWHG